MGRDFGLVPTHPRTSPPALCAWKREGAVQAGTSPRGRPDAPSAGDSLDAARPPASWDTDLGRRRRFRAAERSGLRRGRKWGPGTPVGLGRRKRRESGRSWFGPPRCADSSPLRLLHFPYFWRNLKSLLLCLRPGGGDVLNIGGLTIMDAEFLLLFFFLSSPEEERERVGGRRSKSEGVGGLEWREKVGF